MIGREAPAPNPDALTPSSAPKVSPKELLILNAIQSPIRLLVGLRICIDSSLPSGLAEL